MPLGNYTPHTWVNGVSAANAAKMNNIETGLDAVTDAVRLAQDRSLDVREFGATDPSTGTVDAAPAIWAAIQEAFTSGIGIIDFPWGENGIYRCDTPIVNGVHMPDGLTFRAAGRTSPAHATDGVKIRYTGTGTCWNIQEPDGSQESGRWEFDGLIFEATHKAGTMFQLNDLTRHPDVNPQQGNINFVKFTRCIAWGGTTDNTGTGDFFRAAKTLHIETDRQCYFRSWRRAFNLTGCDNSTIRGRFTANIQHIHHEAYGTWGNNFKVDTDFLGPLYVAPVTDGTEEKAYMLYITTNECFVYSPWMETGFGTTLGADAMIYYDGDKCHIYSPTFQQSGGASAPHNGGIHFGPNARNLQIYNPLGEVTDLTNIYDAPNTWEWLLYNNTYPHKMVVHSPARRLEDILLTPHPRLKVISDLKRDQYLPYLGSTGPAGTSLVNTTLTALNLENGGPIGGYSWVTPVEDTAALGGWTMRLPATNGSATLVLKAGRDIAPTEMVKVDIRYRLASTPTSGSFHYISQKNGSGGTQGTLPNTTTYRTESFSYALTADSFVAGDQLLVGVYNSSNVQAFVESISCTVGPAPGVRWATAVPSSGYHAQGERYVHPKPASGTMKETVCIASGTPGTWNTVMIP